jgi:dihydropyrimidinase
MSILIKGGRVVTATDDYEADVFVEGEAISLIGRNLDASADTVVDARQMLLLPGCVDPHTHLDSHYEGLTTCDDFTTGTVAAVCGGTTSIVDFCMQYRGERLWDALEVWRQKLATHPPVIDVGFHMVISDLEVSHALDDLSKLCDEGITSYKLFLAYKESIMVDDETMFRTMLAAAENGALVLVHAENGDAIDVLIRQALAEGNTSAAWHARTRPPITEAEATSRALHLGRLAGAPVYIVHVSSEDAIAPLARARSLGWRAWGETCTQYLLLDESVLGDEEASASKYVFTPPPRERRHQAQLWKALAGGVLSVVSSDHTAYLLRDKLAGGDFADVPQGVPGIEERLVLVHDAGVRTGSISLSRMVELLSTNPARLFGLYPKKGTIAVGSDADIVVFDPALKRTLSAARHHSRVDYSLYESREVTGAPRTVIARGRVLVDEGEFVGEAGTGRFLARTRFAQPGFPPTDRPHDLRMSASPQAGSVPPLGSAISDS